MPPVTYDCQATLPGFSLEYPPEWRVDGGMVAPNQGRLVLSLDDQSATVVVEWGPGLTPQGILDEAEQAFVRHEIVAKQRVATEGILWSELVYQGWKEARDPQPDRVCARLTQRSGTIWRIGYRLAGAMGSRRRPVVESILKRFRFLPARPPNEGSWRHHRYMADTLEFAFNHPTVWDVVPAVQGGSGACSVELPGGGTFLAQWGPQLPADRFLDQQRMAYREFNLLLERPRLALKSGTWDEFFFDGKMAPASDWSGEAPRLDRGRYRFGILSGMAWILGYTVPHDQLAIWQPTLDRMMASMRILGQAPQSPGEPLPLAKGLSLDLGIEMAATLPAKSPFEATPFVERLNEELQLLRTMLAYEGVLLPPLSVRANPELPAFGYRIAGGNQVFAERDLGKDDVDPLTRMLEEIRSEATKLDGLFTPRLARPDLVAQLFPRAPNAYEKLRSLRPELQLPPLTP
ncbi:MAG TPA: hypothetical protein V6D05_05060 [Stenomitos sp.]